jgi:restriction system protein
MVAATPLPGQEVGWLRRHAGTDIDKLDGKEFEGCLAAMFTVLGYRVELTEWFDYGADLVVSIDGHRTAVQAKRHDGCVGEKAVQQVVASRAHYRCDRAVVVTNSELNRRARRLALDNDVEILERPELTQLLEEASLIETPEPLPAPVCSRCGIQLVRRESHGHRFWGCVNYPRGCRETSQVRQSLILRRPSDSARETFGISSNADDSSFVSPRVPRDTALPLKASAPWMPINAYSPGSERTSQIHVRRRRLGVAAASFGWFCVSLAIIDFLAAAPSYPQQRVIAIWMLACYGLPTLWGTWWLGCRSRNRKP